MRHFLLAFVCALLTLGSLSAQKYGHLNFGNLIAQVPGTKAAEAELAAFNDERVARGEQMVADLRRRVEEIQTQMEDLPPVRLEELKAEINQEREAIARYEQQIGQEVQAKRNELLGAIISEARAAITAVAEANGYVLVFDTSQFNTVLFARETDDLMELVKAEMGL